METIVKITIFVISSLFKLVVYPFIMLRWIIMLSSHFIFGCPERMIFDFKTEKATTIRKCCLCGSQYTVVNDLGKLGFKMLPMELEELKMEAEERRKWARNNPQYIGASTCVSGPGPWIWRNNHD